MSTKKDRLPKKPVKDRQLKMPVDPRQLMLPLDQPESVPVSPSDSPTAPKMLFLPKALTPGVPPVIEPEQRKPAIPGTLRRIVMADLTVEYVLRRSKRRTIGFLINDEGLRVTAPKWITLSEIEQSIRDKQRWIVAKLDHVRERLANPVRQPQQQWRDGAELPYLGKALTLRIRSGCGTGEVLLDPFSDELVVSLPLEAAEHQVREYVKEWMQQEAKQLFAERMPIYAEKLGVTCRSLGLSTATRRWGSCSASGNIRLNWRLIHFPLPLIDYVIVHELAHLREMNHGPRFWLTVGSVCPEYVNTRKNLSKQASAIFSLF